MPQRASTTKVVKSSNRGAKPGERRGGRGRGTPNKATASIRDAAQQYTEEALSVLVEVMADKNAPASARVSAANGVLDRGHGKPQQSVDLTTLGESMAPKGPEHFWKRPDAGSPA